MRPDAWWLPWITADVGMWNEGLRLANVFYDAQAFRAKAYESGVEIHGKPPHSVNQPFGR